MIPSAPSFLENRSLQLLMFGGKGGVGKTTCAAASALRMSALSPDRSLLLVSTDPAHSIRDSLAGLVPPANLRVHEIDARDCLERFHARNGSVLERIASAGTFLDDEDTHKLVNLSLPGLDELMAFLEISDWVEQRAYDCIIVDTAPSGHALRLLAMPELIRSWLAVLDAHVGQAPLHEEGFHPIRARRRARCLRRGVGRFHGSYGKAIARSRPLPVRPRYDCGTAGRPRDGGYGPATAARAHTHIRVAGESASSGGTLPVLFPGPRTGTAGNSNLCEPLPRLASHSFWGVELFPGEVRGQPDLQSFWSHAALLSEEPEIRIAAPRSGEDHRRRLCTSIRGIRFILISGKGGVGKTTFACATALRLAHDFPGKRVLLFSTDSAHSLSACFKTRIGPRPVVISGNLSAIEIDAAAEFRALKDHYAKDVDDLVRTIAPGFDPTFDRVVLEKMVDLAPPGLDEVMALLRIVDFLAQDRYDLFVMDAASTGHLLRLLELPELIDQWLKIFFGLFLKYEHILRMPRFSGQLIDLSKNLKRLRKLLSDPFRAALYVVAIPTQMAWEETKDLIARLRSNGDCDTGPFPQHDDPTRQLRLVHRSAAQRTGRSRSSFGAPFRTSPKSRSTAKVKLPESNGWTNWAEACTKRGNVRPGGRPAFGACPDRRAGTVRRRPALCARPAHKAQLAGGVIMLRKRAGVAISSRSQAAIRSWSPPRPFWYVWRPRKERPAMGWTATSGVA